MTFAFGGLNLNFLELFVVVAKIYRYIYCILSSTWIYTMMLLCSRSNISS